MSLEDPQPKKRGRGRPRKTEVEAKKKRISLFICSGSLECMAVMLPGYRAANMSKSTQDGPSMFKMSGMEVMVVSGGFALWLGALMRLSIAVGSIVNLAMALGVREQY